MSETTACPDCGGLGQALERGALQPCVDCDGEGIVPAVTFYDYIGHEREHGVEYDLPYLIPVPKEYRHDAAW